MTNDALLDEVRAAAQAALEAHAEGAATAATARRTATAAHAALDAGYSITAIAAAEQQGERSARERVRTQVLRAVERSAKKKQEATEEHDRLVVRAVALGLPARDIATRAGVSHGTVAAVARRHGQPATPPPNEAVEANGSGPSDGGAAISVEAG